MRTIFFILLPFILFRSTERIPMKANFQESAPYRWLNKKVLDNRLLDNMQNPDHWEAFTTGAQQIVDAREVAKAIQANQVVAQISINNEITCSKDASLKLRIPSRLDVPAPKSGRGWGTAGVRRKFDGENWENFNRISIWIFPDNPGFYVNWIELRVFNDGVEKLPALFGQEGESSFLLRDREWNHLVWEISNVARDKITSLEVSCYLAGNEPEATDTLTYYLDQLELQVVEPDYIEGWEVWPGRISYCHAGYLPGAEKKAISSGLSATEFNLINQETGQPVLKKPIEIFSSPLGRFQVMDFSEIHRPGTYLLEAGEVKTPPFRIGNDVWRSSLIKALNFFYSERCGMEIPGVHGNCHRDWICTHGEKTMVVNGGWHDAGDLTQGLGNTGEAVYTLFRLAGKPGLKEEDPELYDLLIGEGKWGLEWILKTSFRDGYRYSGSANSRRTDGIMGTEDDLFSVPRNNPMDHLVAAAAEAIGSRAFIQEDSRWSAFALKMAEEDWACAENWTPADPAASGTIFRGNFDSDASVIETASQGVLASMELWKTTGKDKYIRKATEWARIIVDAQQRVRPDWEVPLTGFFYTGPDKKHILHYCHRGREHAPVLALTRLCESLPDHPDWMMWYSAVVLHAEYLKTMANYTQPYEVMPASVYNDQEYLLAPESRRESYRKQVLNGIPLGKGFYLRLFPVWMDYRGHFGTILPQAKALALACHLRGDAASLQTAIRQMEWVIGRNPFAQSTMWGEGHDFTPLYTVLSGDMVGGLPVGIQTRAESDIPYWPVQNTWTYKEIWVHPVIQWIGLMEEVTGSGKIEGFAPAEVNIQDVKTGKSFKLYPDRNTGNFSMELPSGEYEVRCGGNQYVQDILPGKSTYLDLGEDRFLELEVSSKNSGPGEITIEARVRGSGTHEIRIRSDNLAIPASTKQITLKKGQASTVEWKGKIISVKAPWVVLVIPDNQVSRGKEITDARRIN